MVNIKLEDNNQQNILFNQISPFVSLSLPNWQTARSNRHNTTKAKPAAVLFSFINIDGSWRIILTKRKANLQNHANQISFPGGVIDNCETPQQCALREASEEINLPESVVNIVGYLPTYYVRTGFTILPIVAIIDINYNYSKLLANSAEVEKIIIPPWSFFTNRDSWYVNVKVFPNHVLRSFAINWQEGNSQEIIWGATARILYRLARNFFNRHRN